MPNYVDDYGLINARPNEKNGENSLLYTAENILIKELLGKNNFQEKLTFYKAVKQCRDSKGIFSQTPARNLTGNDQYMSHDQLTAIFAISRKYGFEYHIEIWEEIKRQLFFYDNVNPRNPSITSFLHPRDIIYYGICAGSKLWYLGIPLLVIMAVISCWPIKENRHGIDIIPTSGKLLTFVRFSALKGIIPGFSGIYDFLTEIIRIRLGGWPAAFLIFFPYTDHPNNEAWK